MYIKYSHYWSLNNFTHPYTTHLKYPKNPPTKLFGNLLIITYGNVAHWHIGCATLAQHLGKSLYYCYYYWGIPNGCMYSLSAWESGIVQISFKGKLSFCFFFLPNHIRFFPNIDIIVRWWCIEFYEDVKFHNYVINSIIERDRHYSFFNELCPVARNGITWSACTNRSIVIFLSS